MGGREFGNRNVGPVRAAISMYGGRSNLDVKPALGRRHFSLPPEPEQSSSSRAKDLVREPRRDDADSVRLRAETELSEAKKTVQNLKSLIEGSDGSISSLSLKGNPARGEWRSHADARCGEMRLYEEVMRELEIVKQELSKLKLEVASILEEKSQAEKEAKESSSKVASYGSSVEALTAEIEELNEEQVLVELARIEALKELGGIEVQREREASVHSAEMDEVRRKIKEASEELDRSKEMEAKLDVTMSDIEVLQIGLSLARDMQKKKDSNTSIEDDSRASSSLRSIKEELERAKKEMASISEEGFQCMASMDVIRNELKHVVDEITRLKKKEESVDSTVQSLDSKLLRAKSKLEAVTAAEEKTNLLASNLSSTLEKLRAESKAAEKEKETIEEETRKIKAEIEKTESGIDSTEEKLQGAMLELEEAKAREASALERLGMLIERTAQERASASRHGGSRITISKFEYDYLTGRATVADEIADKKVAAAEAWIEALRASEKEILLKSGMAKREVEAMRFEEEQQVFRTERSLSAKKKVEGELNNWRPQNRRDVNEYVGSPALRRSTTPRGVSVNKSPVRKFRVRKSGLGGSLHPQQMARSPSIVLKRRKKVMPNISKLFGRKKIQNSE